LSIEDSPPAGDELATALALVEFDPAAFSPVTPAFMFAPAILIPLVIGPPPTIGMNYDSEFGTIIMMLPHMPAITFTVAGNVRRGGGRSQSQSACGAK
jgi:hypothetical protein